MPDSWPVVCVDDWSCRPGDPGQHLHDYSAILRRSGRGFLAGADRSDRLLGEDVRKAFGQELAAATRGSTTRGKLTCRAMLSGGLVGQRGTRGWPRGRNAGTAPPSTRSPAVAHGPPSCGRDDHRGRSMRRTRGRKRGTWVERLVGRCCEPSKRLLDRPTLYPRRHLGIVPGRS